MSSLRALLWPFVAFLLGVAVFVNATDSGWSNWDDTLYVLGRPAVLNTSWDALLRLWSWRDAFSGNFIEYFPLRDSVYWLTHRVAGTNPIFYHMVNIFFHGLCCAAVVVLGQRLGLTLFASTVAGAIFALHPVHCESVVWIAGLKDPMFLLFSLISLILFEPDSSGKRRYLLSVVFMLLALLCKSIAIMVPTVMVCLEWRRHASVRQIVRWVAGPTAIALFFTVNFVLIGLANNVIAEPLGSTIFMTAMTSAWCGVLYVSKTFFPADLYFFYCIEAIKSVGEIRAVVAIGVVLALAAGQFALSRRNRTLAVLGAWFPLFLLPVSGLVPIPVFMADRYLYAPSVAFALGAGIALQRLLARQRVLGVVAFVLLAFGYGARTVVRNDDWRSPVALWTGVVEQPEAASFDSPWIKLGDAYMRENRYNEAEEALLKALEIQKIDNRYSLRTGIANGVIGLLYQEIKKDAESRRCLRVALEYDARSPPIWNALSITEGNLGDHMASEFAADRALALDPEFHSARYNRGLARLGSGRVDDGLADLVVAVTREPAMCRKLRLWRKAVGDTPAAVRVDSEVLGSHCR